MHELAFSGVQGAPCPIGTFKGKRAKARAIEAARRESGDRVSITAVEVVQRGGAGDGTVVERFTNPDAYMPAGHPYCAAVYVDRKTLAIIGVYAVSRDSRVRHTTPPAYTFETLSPATIVTPGPAKTRAEVLDELAAAFG